MYIHIECWGRNEVKRNTEQANFVNIKEAESQKIERQIGMGWESKNYSTFELYGNRAEKS